jgi:hypothetical protein
MCLAALESMEFVCDVCERRNDPKAVCKHEEEGAAPPEGSVRRGSAKVALPREKRPHFHTQRKTSTLFRDQAMCND